MEVDLAVLYYHQPTLLLEEAQYFLLDHHEVWMSTSSISRRLRKLNITRKKVQHIAANRSAYLRGDWIMQVGQFRAEHFVTVDESYCSGKSVRRSYGYAPSGIPATVEIEKLKMDRFTVLPAYTTNGYMDEPLIVQGSVTGDLFYNWLRQSVLSRMNSFDPFAGDPAPRSILIMDNNSTHRSSVSTCSWGKLTANGLQEIRDLCGEFGVKIMYLPPYSPDFNPIEASFNLYKRILKKNNKLCPRFGTPGCNERFIEFLAFSIKEFNLKTEHKKLWQWAGFQL
jgi:transposase